MTKTNIRYEDFQGFIQHRANKASTLTGIPASDFLSAGNEAFVKATAHFQPLRGAFPSYLDKCLYSAFADVVEESRETLTYADPDFCIEDLTAESHEEAAKGSNLSAEAKEALLILVDAPREILDLLMSRRNTRKLRGWWTGMMRSKGYTEYRIKAVCAELKNSI